MYCRALAASSTDRAGHHVNWLEYLLSAFVGSRRARDQHKKALTSGASIAIGLAELSKLAVERSGQEGESPIFLLCAGWRSGSTLLQRLIMSDPAVMLWGEPYDECGVIQALADTLKAFRRGWPPSEYYYDGRPREQLTGDWIANLFPSADALRQGHRMFFETVFAVPARDAGAKRWGIKEVRLNAGHAQYLHWLFPQASFVFLLRNPLDAYRSYCRYGRNWYDTWPDRPVFTPTAFGRHWRELAEGFVRDAPRLNALVIRYEELTGSTQQVVAKIEQHLDIRLDASVIGKKVGTSERGGEQAWISRLEKSLLWRAVSPLAEDLGYK
jgi:hypothetical protein